MPKTQFFQRWLCGNESREFRADLPFEIPEMSFESGSLSYEIRGVKSCQ